MSWARSTMLIPYGETRNTRSAFKSLFEQFVSTQYNTLNVTYIN